MRGRKGPDRNDSNRFSLLADPPIKKTKSCHSANTNPVSVFINPNPKYLLISSLNENLPLSKVSPFIIKKKIEDISKEFDSISLLRDGSILVLARNEYVAELFLQKKKLGNEYPVSIKLHESLNSVKGIIYAPCLIHVPDNEIIEELKSQGVASIYKYTRTVDGKQSPTGKMVVTFDLFRLPESLDVAWYKVKVTPYIPNPMRCKNCQLLGHTQKRCKNNPSCGVCNLPPHQPIECTRKMCANCLADHTSFDNSCPKYKQAKEILKIKTVERCSMAEARNKYKTLNPINMTTNANSFADIVKNSNNSAENIVSPNKPATTNIETKNSKNQNLTALKSHVNLNITNPSYTPNSLDISSTNPQNNLNIGKTNLSLYTANLNSSNSLLTSNTPNHSFTDTDLIIHKLSHRIKTTNNNDNSQSLETLTNSETLENKLQIDNSPETLNASSLSDISPSLSFPSPSWRAVIDAEMVTDS